MALAVVCRWTTYPLKFQGDTDMAPLRALAGIEGARLVHLHHNKHELTWVRTPPDDPA
ncbi:MAG: hypothetical protein U0326_33245 [Polyangiales bacterium]